MENDQALTPVMRQYFAAKQAHPDCLMFCRIGDFYELFYEDAILVARELQLTLTARDREKKQPMCGVPYHAAEIYLQRLLRKGYRIALCEQMEDPKTVKGIVKREVTRVLTPGTAVDPGLGAGESCWLASVACLKSTVGVGLVDLSTGEFAQPNLPRGSLRPTSLRGCGRSSWCTRRAACSALDGNARWAATTRNRRKQVRSRRSGQRRRSRTG